jgi:hypothetical protein
MRSLFRTVFPFGATAARVVFAFDHLYRVFVGRIRTFVAAGDGRAPGAF